MKQLRYILGCLAILCCASTHAQTAPITVNPGTPQKICPYIGVTLGGNPTGSGGAGTLKYAWSPKSTLNDSTLANPTAYPLVTTTYTVVVSDGSESKTGTITITVNNVSVNAGPDITIQQGQTITLHATGTNIGSVAWGGSDPHMYNTTTLNPDVFPSQTATYTVYATSTSGGCVSSDVIVVTVIKGTNLFFYNTFTPNGDGTNDYFYIGNIDQFPDNVLEVYNRYGQKVFNKTGYQNDWDGKYLNDELPAGTYFYVLDAKTNANGVSGGKHKGSVTIVR